jgi:hypothetical protein
MGLRPVDAAFVGFLKASRRVILRLVFGLGGLCGLWFDDAVEIRDRATRTIDRIEAGFLTEQDD